MNLSAQATEEASMHITEPMKLVEESGVAFKETNRFFHSEKFYGLKKRYSCLEGIVMIGLTNEQGELLLRGPENWAPPGGPVPQGDEWSKTAREIINKQTGLEITIEKVVLVERMNFYLKGNREAHFSGMILHLQASLLNKNNGEMAGDFKWYSEVPDNAHPNHVDHIKLYLNH